MSYKEEELKTIMEKYKKAQKRGLTEKERAILEEQKTKRTSV